MMNKKVNMMKMVRCSLIFLLTLSCLCSTLFSSDKKMVAIVTTVKKNVEVRKAETEVWLKVKVGDFLHEGDYVKTGKNSEADISFITGVRINLKEDTEIEIKQTRAEEKGNETKLEVFKGKLFNKVRKLSRMEIKTPQAIAAVRGTEFGVEVSDLTRIYVLEGLVDVWNSQGKVELKEGMETTVESGKPPKEPEEMDEEEKKEEQGESEDILRLSIKGQLTAGKPVEMELAVVDEQGKIKTVNKKIKLEASNELLCSTDKNKWKRLPYNLKLKEGRGNFFVKSMMAGSVILWCKADDVSPVVVELGFTLPKEKELIIELDDDGQSRKLRLHFERQE